MRGEKRGQNRDWKRREERKGTDFKRRGKVFWLCKKKKATGSRGFPEPVSRAGDKLNL